MKKGEQFFTVVRPRYQTKKTTGGNHLGSSRFHRESRCCIDGDPPQLSP
jgi:hypothetical protein